MSVHPGSTVEQDELVVRARESLDASFAALKLTPAEELTLAPELAQLRALAEKLDAGTVEIAAFGMVSRGKSSILNALMGRDAFKSGVIHGTTTSRDAQLWQSVEGEGPGGGKLVLVDTPGIDEVGGESRERLAREVARHADLILFVVSGDMQRVELEALSTLRECQKPILVVFNQVDRYPEADRDAIYAKIKDERVRHLVRADDVVMAAAKPDPVRVKIRRPDGSSTIEFEQPVPLIEPLKERILAVLAREGKALVALNAMLFADDLHREIVAHKFQIRDDAANRAIWSFAVAKGLAVALNPIAVADIAGGVAVDIGMVVALSKVYGIPLTKKTAAGLVRDMAFSMGAMGVVELGTRLLAGGLKSALAAVTAASAGLALPLTALGYGAIGLAQGGAAALTSYVLGRGAKVYLQQGGSWGKKGIKTVIHEILEQAKADSVLDRLKEDLRKKVIK